MRMDRSKRRLINKEKIKEEGKETSKAVMEIAKQPKYLKYRQLRN